MTASVEAAFAPARSSGPATNSSFALGVLTISLALAGALAAAGCGSSSSTSTGPSPVKCQVSLEAPSITIDATGGKGAITVSTQPECAWTASSDANWISGLSPTSGQGSAQVEFQAAANPAASMRQGDIAVNDRHIDVQQNPAPCRFEIAPVNQTMGAAGGTVSVTVATLAGCAWQATSEVDWIAIGAADANSVQLVVAANGQGARSASILIAGQTLTLSQAASAPNCAFSLDRPTQAMGAAGGSATVTVTASPGCSWTAGTDAPWITVVAAPNRTGNGVVSFDVMANPGAARAGTVTIAGQTITVDQAAAPAAPVAPVCAFSIAPTNQSIGAAGGPGAAISITASAGCSWTAASNASWITLTSTASGSGTGTATFNVATNTGAARSGTLTIAGQTFTVNQDAPTPTCAFSIAPANQSVGAAGGAGGPISITTSAGCSWTAASNAAWITLTSPASGSGSASATFSVAANTGTARSGTLTIAGQTFTVNQAAAPPPTCTFSIAPTSQSVGAAAGAGSAIAITTSAGCSWTAASNAAWITLTSPASGSGSASATFSVAANTGTARSGTLTIAGQTFTVNQAAAPPPTCTFSIAPTSQSVGAAAGAGSPISIATSAGCTWTAASNASWITLTSAASGSGNGSATFSVAANTGNARSGTLTIASQTFTVNQAAAPPSCTFVLAPTNQSIGAAGGNGAAISLTTGVGCSWTAASNASWITLTSAASGSGNGSATFTVAANTGNARSGTLTIGGQTFTVNQASGCTYSINPTSRSIGENGATGREVAVTTVAGCGWTANSNDSWITVTAGSTGTGNGTVRFNVAANSGKKRTGTLTIAGRTFKVEQDNDDDDD